MAKRFLDTEIFKKAWYRKSSTKQKCFFTYLILSCSHSGFLDVDLELFSFMIGEKITKNDLDYFGNDIVYITDDLIFMPNFVKFQCGITCFSELSESTNAHKQIIKDLKKYNLFDFENNSDLFRLEDHHYNNDIQNVKSELVVKKNEKHEEDFNKLTELWNRISWTKERRFNSEKTRKAFIAKVQARIKTFGADLIERWHHSTDNAKMLPEATWFSLEWAFKSDDNMEKLLSGKYDKSFVNSNSLMTFEEKASKTQRETLHEVAKIKDRIDEREKNISLKDKIRNELEEEEFQKLRIKAEIEKGLNNAIKI